MGPKQSNHCVRSSGLTIHETKLVLMLTLLNFFGYLYQSNYTMKTLFTFGFGSNGQVMLFN